MLASPPPPKSCSLPSLPAVAMPPQWTDGSREWEDTGVGEGSWGRRRRGSTVGCWVAALHPAPGSPLPSFRKGNLLVYLENSCKNHVTQLLCKQGSLKWENEYIKLTYSMNILYFQICLLLTRVSDEFYLWVVSVKFYPTPRF